LLYQSLKNSNLAFYEMVANGYELGLLNENEMSNFRLEREFLLIASKFSEN